MVTVYNMNYTSLQTFLRIMDIAINKYIKLDLRLSLWNEYCCLVSGFLHRVQGEFTDDISETAVGPIFTGHELQPVKIGPTVVSETSTVNSRRYNHKTKKQNT
jgi:hypothetical protein